MRLAVLAAVLATAPPVVAAPATAVPLLSSDVRAALELEQLARAFEASIVPTAIVDQLVETQVTARDALHNLGGTLAAWAGISVSAPGLALPDLSVLTVNPVASMAMEESSGFGWRDDPIRHDRRYHAGTDFRAKPGTPVVVAGPGKVVFAGRQGGYGNVVYVDHGGGVITRYAHMSRILAKKDAMVMAGDEIGRVGSTGRATGPHLHFEIRLDNRAVDPITAMAVAELERDAPMAGWLASYALAPEIQAKARDHSDEHKKQRRETRPERAGRGKRQQVLW